MFLHANCDVETVGFSKEADYYASDEVVTRKSGRLGIRYRLNGKDRGDIVLSMAGRFNIYNSLCAIAVCRRLGVSFENIRQSLCKTQVK